MRDDDERALFIPHPSSLCTVVSLPSGPGIEEVRTPLPIDHPLTHDLALIVDRFGCGQFPT
jgi:hypothetical protein